MLSALVRKKNVRIVVHLMLLSNRLRLKTLGYRDGINVGIRCKSTSLSILQ